MKTILKSKKERNFRNITFKVIAVAVIFGIFTFTVNAQNLLHSISGLLDYRDWTLAMETGISNLNYTVASNENANSTNLWNEYLEPETEAPMELENWMMNENNFDASFVVESAIENPAELEDWMTDANHFYNAVNVISETENPMVLENWMTNDNLFNVPSFSIETETEGKLELENWMTDENRFNCGTEIQKRNFVQSKTFIFQDSEDKKLELEPWMVNHSRFVF